MLAATFASTGCVRSSLSITSARSPVKRAITSTSFACSAGESSMMRAKTAKAGLERRVHSAPCSRCMAATIDSPGLRARTVSIRAASRSGSSSKKRSSLLGK